MSNLYLPTPYQRMGDTDDQPGDDALRLQNVPSEPTPNHSRGGRGARGQDHTSPLNGLVLSEELSQSLSTCSLKVIALGQEEAGWLIPHFCRMSSKCHVHTPQDPGTAVDEARWLSAEGTAPFRYCFP